MTRSWLVTLRRYAVAGVMFMALGCAGVLQHTPGSTAADGGSVPKQLQSRQVIVILAATTPERRGSLDQPIAQAYDLSQVGAFPLLSLGVQCLVFQIPEGRAVDEVMARLAADPRVALVQPNQVFQGLHAAHNDPYATLQYGARAIRADLAHRWATGHGVKVAVVDTGVDTKHPDLHGRIIRTINFVEGGERTFARDSHGTAVAGVIAATADYEVGIFGIAPQADIVVARGRRDAPARRAGRLSMHHASPVQAA